MSPVGREDMGKTPHSRRTLPVAHFIYHEKYFLFVGGGILQCSASLAKEAD
jgi:hypothetical protein